MKTIHKYPIETKTRQLLKMPKGSEILKVTEQFGKIKLWAMVDTEAENEEIEIEVHGMYSNVLINL